MEIAGAVLSYPILQYKVSITHVTARESIAFEWLILQAVATIEDHPEFGEFSVEEFFSSLFGISDTDTMLKGLIIGLINNYAALTSAVSISDDTHMDRIKMSVFRITDDGRKMQKLGKLPGKQTNNTMSVYYDPVGTNLWLKSYPGQLKAERNGIDMGHIDPESVVFPANLIVEKINALRENNDTRPEWMADNTELSDVVPMVHDTEWRNERVTVSLDENLRLYIEGMSAEDEKTVISEIMPAFLTESEDIAQINFDSPENEIEKLTLINDTSYYFDWLNTFKGNMYVADARRCPKNIINGGKPFKGGGMFVEVLCGADDFRYELRKEKSSKNGTRRIVSVYVPEQYLSDGIVFSAADTCFGVGRMMLKNGDDPVPADVMYLPKNVAGAAVDEILKEVVANHYAHKPELVFLLYNADTQLIRKYLTDIVAACGTVGEKLNKITELNDISYGIIDKKYIKEPLMAEMLIGSGEEMTAAQTSDRIVGFANEQLIRKNEELMKLLIRFSFACVKPVSGVKELYSLLERIVAIDRKYEAFIRKNRDITEHLYSDRVKEEIVSRFADSDFFGAIPEYTAAEENIRELRRLADNVSEELEISIYDRVSSEIILKTVLENRDRLKSLYNCYSEWRKRIAEFTEIYGEPEVYSGSCKALINAIEAFEKLGEALGRFYCDTSTFGRIVVADTSTLMECEAIIERFNEIQQPKTMLIIPVTVLEELDGLKKDSERGARAQSVLKSIEKMRNLKKNWLNISEQSNTELMPPDFDRELPDNKIISVAMKYQLRNPIILAEDINIRNKADALGMKAMSGDSFFEEHRAKNAPVKQNQTKKKKKR